MVTYLFWGKVSIIEKIMMYGFAILMFGLVIWMTYLNDINALENRVKNLENIYPPMKLQKEISRLEKEYPYYKFELKKK